MNCGLISVKYATSPKFLLTQKPQSRYLQQSMNMSHSCVSHRPDPVDQKLRAELCTGLYKNNLNLRVSVIAGAAATGLGSDSSAVLQLSTNTLT